MPTRCIIAILIGTVLTQLSLAEPIAQRPEASVDDGWFEWSTMQERQPTVLPGLPSESGVTVNVWVRATGNPESFPSLVSNKDWESGTATDLISNSNMGITLDTGPNPGFVIGIQPNGAWFWNMGSASGESRLDYLPTPTRQTVVDDRDHMLSFNLIPDRKEARLYYDGRNVAIYALNGFGTVPVNGYRNCITPARFG